MKTCLKIRSNFIKLEGENSQFQHREGQAKTLIRRQSQSHIFHQCHHQPGSDRNGMKIYFLHSDPVVTHHWHPMNTPAENNLQVQQIGYVHISTA